MNNVYKIAFRTIGNRSCSYKSVRRPIIPIRRTPTATQLVTEKPTNVPNLVNQIRAKIMTTGPITVAEYMREVLTNPSSGYYMNRDVFGKEGDFITSPEISQIFGELIALWILVEWRKIGSPAPFQIVELGPGRGTLTRDILKVLSKFQPGSFSLHMVEISPYLSKMQAQRFCFKHELFEDDTIPYYQKGETISGIDVFWYNRLEDVPQMFSIIVAHEFFDALPIHKLQLDEGVWKEVLIDVNVEAENEFRYVLSKSQTPISQLYQPKENEIRQTLEYPLESDRIIGLLAERFERNGGIGLIMDYGHNGEKSDTFRAFRKHALHDPLIEPGTADLTADVDFAHMKRIAEQKSQVVCYGPVEQRFFLKNMEGDARLGLLLESALPENKKTIETGYHMLTDPKQMGARFKFLSMFPSILKDHLAKFSVNGFC